METKWVVSYVCVLFTFVTFLTGMETGLLRTARTGRYLFMTFLTGMETQVFFVYTRLVYTAFMTFLTGMETFKTKESLKKSRVNCPSTL
jgi:hypothetical protein